MTLSGGGWRGAVGGLMGHSAVVSAVTCGRRGSSSRCSLLTGVGLPRRGAAGRRAAASCAEARRGALRCWLPVARSTGAALAFVAARACRGIPCVRACVCLCVCVRARLVLCVCASEYVTRTLE